MPIENLKRIKIFFLGILLSMGFWADLRGQEVPEKRFPEGRGRMRMMGTMHRSLGDWAQLLNLAPEQLTRFQDLRESFLKETLAWRNELIIKRFDLRNLLNSPQTNPDQALAKQREISALQARIQERRVIYEMEMRKVLTPEQIKVLPPNCCFGHPGPWMMPRGPSAGSE